MKISEMTNDQATEALIRLSNPLSNLLDNEEFVSILTRAHEMRREPNIKILGKILPQLLIYGLKEHKQDIYEIVAALQMVPVSKIGNANFTETYRIIKDSYDEILRDFFTSTADAARIAGNASV